MTRGVATAATEFLPSGRKKYLKGVARCHGSVVLAGARLYTRTSPMTFLWDLCDTPHNPTHRCSISYCFYCFIFGWLKINQFAGLNGFSGLKRRLNKLSRELSTESVDTFDRSETRLDQFLTDNHSPTAQALFPGRPFSRPLPTRSPVRRC